MANNTCIIKLNGGIFGLRGTWLGGIPLFNTYSYILCSEKNGEILLIDTGSPGNGDAIKGAVESIGRSVSDITGVALTQWHRDHTGGLAGIVSMAGTPEKPVKVFIHKYDSPFLLSQRRSFVTFQPELKLKLPHKPGELPGSGLFQLTELDHESGINPLNQWGVEFIHTPGHTPGHTSYLHRESMSLFAGSGLSLLDRSTAGLVAIFSDREKQVESARMLADMEFNWLCPAHLHLRTDMINRERRIPFSGRVPLRERITGSLPLFSYPEN